MTRVGSNEFQKIWHLIQKCFDISRLTCLPEGRYDIGNGIYVNIESYMTQEITEKKFEVHRRYIDVQYIISGEEKLYLAKDSMECGGRNYDAEKDIEFLQQDVSAEMHELSAGEKVIIMPKVAHKPCITRNERIIVKKAVFKIPIVLLKELKYMVLDVDGTLTDGKIYMGNEGEWCKAFDIKDGYGITKILPGNSILPVIITGRYSEIVSNRCKELNIDNVFQGCNNKLEILAKFVQSEGDSLRNVIYIGDDINDMSCMRAVQKEGGLVACPIDAVDKIRDIADFISLKNGGNGAVREVIDWVCTR